MGELTTLRLVDQVLETLLRKALDGVVAKVSSPKGCSSPLLGYTPLQPAGPRVDQLANRPGRYTNRY